MATLAETSPQQHSTVQAPPTERYTIIGWLHKNLFGSLFDTVLTILAVTFIYSITRPLISWAINGAEWAVIAANWNLIMRGRYPAEEAWRLWICFNLLGGLTGLCWGVWGRKVQTATVVVFSIPLLLILVPFFEPSTRTSLLTVEIIAIVGFLLGRFLPRNMMHQLAVTFIMLFLPAILVILYGIPGDSSLLPIVKTNRWGGLVLSMLLSALGIVFSYPLGILLALGRRSNLPAIKTICVVYIELIRGVPLISLLFMAIVMLQLFLPPNAPVIDSLLRVTVAIVLFSAAYVAEIVRGGLQAVPTGQYEAAHALGLSNFQMMTRIILPQALKIVIPVTVSQFIGLFKDTSLIALVGLFDLLGIGRAVLANTNWLGTHREVYVFIGVLYWVFCFAMSYASQKLESALNVEAR